MRVGVNPLVGAAGGLGLPQTHCLSRYGVGLLMPNEGSSCAEYVPLGVGLCCLLSP